MKYITSQLVEVQQLATHSTIEDAASSRVNRPASAAPRGTTPCFNPDTILFSSGDAHRSAAIVPTKTDMQTLNTAISDQQLSTNQPMDGSQEKSAYK